MRATGRNRILAWTALLCAGSATLFLTGCQPSATDSAVVQPEMSLAPAPTDVPTPKLEYPDRPKASDSKDAIKPTPASTTAAAGDQPTPATATPEVTQAPKAPATPPIPAKATRPAASAKPAGIPECRPFQMAFLQDASVRRANAERDLANSKQGLANLTANLNTALKRNNGKLARSLRDRISTLRNDISTSEHVINTSSQTIRQVQKVCREPGGN